MRVAILVLLALSLVAFGMTTLIADEERPLGAGFDGTPAPHLLVSKDGTLRWTGILGDRRLRHGSGVQLLAISADGSKIVSGGEAHLCRIKIWDANSGREIRTVRVFEKVPSPWLASLALTPDGSRIIAGSPFGIMEIWDIETGTLVRSIERDCGGTSRILVSPDSRWMAYACTRSEPPCLTIRELESGKLLRRLLTREGMIRGLAISPDGSEISAWSSVEKRLQVWDAKTGREKRILVPELQIFDADLSADGRWLAPGQEELKILDTATGRVRLRLSAPPYEEPGELLSGQPDSFARVIFDPNARWFATTHILSSIVRIWSLKTGKLLHAISLPLPAQAIEVSADGRWICTGHHDGAIRCVDVETGKLRASSAGPETNLVGLAVDAAGKHVYSAEGSTITVRSVATGAVVRKMTHAEATDDRGISSFAMNPDGTLLVSGGGDMNVWDGRTGKRLLTLAGRRHQDPIMKGFFGEKSRMATVAVDPRGRWIVGCESLGAVTIWDARTGEIKARLPERLGRAKIAFAPDGTWFVTAQMGGEAPIRLWDLSTGTLIRALSGSKGELVATLAVGSNGKWLATAGQDELTIWNVASGQRVRNLKTGEPPVMVLAASSKGPWLYGATAEGLLRVWNSSTGKLRDRIAVDTPVEHIATQGNRLWLGLTNATINVYEHNPK